MPIKAQLVKSFIRNGYAEKSGNKIWDIAERKFLYMTPELAKAFLNLKNFEAYKSQVVDREIALIHATSPTLVDEIGEEPFNLIDIYCGDGTKAVEFIKALDNKVKVRYCAVNVNQYLTDLAVENVKSAGFENVVEYKSHLCDCESTTFSKLSKDLKSKDFKRNVFLLLGSVLASYEINDYLFNISQEMNKGDFLIIGNGIRKGERLVNIDAYKHDVWNQWFINLTRELGINDEDIDYDARFGNSRVEAYYTFNKDRSIDINGKKVNFKKGDEILVAILYKYYAEELDKFCSMYFTDVRLLTDREEEYALAVCRK